MRDNLLFIEKYCHFRFTAPDAVWTFARRLSLPASGAEQLRTARSYSGRRGCGWHERLRAARSGLLA
ncbi:hypothetical protein KIH86_10980 [Paenibacillus sp. HN-1]|uniref:hypothetical protein n=1 Tax=Paenibacillus TaxID=44249 RepID=UPI001CA8AF89|nr:MULTISPECIES: hypothetical protein [Paenibacillus]MBY9077478.1 hypothetical protein [Paenibacillus sp. CGMCC 1.18879]MBY9084745.1 hypothetical protein [Paenibacillus sinensis]